MLACGALGGATGDQLWFYILRGRIHWLDRYPRLGKYRDRVIRHVHAHETRLVLSAAFCRACERRFRLRAPTPACTPLKFSVLNLISAFAWAAAIMAFVKGGSSTLVRVRPERVVGAVHPGR